MFVHTSHLPQLLPAQCYHSAEHKEREDRDIFLPAWHFVGSLDQIPGVGDFVTFTLLDRPLLLYRTGDGVQCFLNVCAHRLSVLTSQPCGHMAPIRCQYHGWEYDESGRTRKIPDARSFRPMRDGQLGLTSVRTETCGQLIFISLAEQGPDLAEFLGASFQTCQELFGADRKRIFFREYDIAANWKVKIENTLESYHIDSVHPRTFRQAPAAENCTHEFDERGSTFFTDEPPASAIQRLFDGIIYELIGVKRRLGYTHCIRYPNFMFGCAGMFSFIEVVMPVAPNRCRMTFAMYGQRGSRRNPISQLLWRVFGYFGRRFTLRALEEDLVIVPQVQCGLESPQQPSGGLISVREERLFHFQQFVRNTCNLE